MSTFEVDYVTRNNSKNTLRYRYHYSAEVKVQDLGTARSLGLLRRLIFIPCNAELLC